MAGQGALSKIVTSLGNYRSLLSRISVLSLPPNSGYKETAKEKLKGLPEKPKRPLNGYVRYVEDRRRELLKESPGIKSQDVAKKCGEEWRTLSEPIKAKYNEEFKLAMDEYRRKHYEYCAKLTDEQKQTLLDVYREKLDDKKYRRKKMEWKKLGKPKRPRTAYMYFVGDKLRGSHGAVTHTLLSKVRTQWADLPDAEKQKYDEQALDDKKRYEIEVKDWEARMIREGKMDMIRHSSLIVTPKPKHAQKKKPSE